MTKFRKRGLRRVHGGFAFDAGPLHLIVSRRPGVDYNGNRTVQIVYRYG